MIIYTYVSGTSSGQLLVFSVPSRGDDISFEEYVAGNSLKLPLKLFDCFVINIFLCKCENNINKEVEAFDWHQLRRQMGFYW